MKKREKKAFTLVELLAVIAILTIVLLIAVPIILNLIEEARINAFKDSVLSVFKAVELDYSLSSNKTGEVPKLKMNNNNFKTGIYGYDTTTKEITLINVCDGRLKTSLAQSNNLPNFTVVKDDGQCTFDIMITGANPDVVACSATNTYQDQGASYGNHKITSPDKVDLRYAGSYSLKYSYTADGLDLTANRIVNVTNNFIPTLSLKQESLKIYQNQSFNALDYLVNASDQCEGDITENVEITSDLNIEVPGIYSVFYKAKNRGNVETIKELIITVEELAVPNLVLPPTDGLNDWYKTKQNIAVEYNSSILDGYEYAISVDGGNNYGEWTNGDTNTFLLEENSANIKMKVRGKKGSLYTGVRASSLVKMDTIKPTGNIKLTGLSGKNGWYRSFVTVSSTTNDNLSGVASSVLSKTYVGNTAGDTVTLTITDNAGHETVVSEVVKVDDVAPTAGNVIILGSIGRNGWYVTAVTISQGVNKDDLSGICSADVLPTMMASSGTAVNTVTDCAGNETTTRTQVKVDTDYPYISYSPSYTMVSPGLTFFSCSASDYTSGVSSCTASPSSAYLSKGGFQSVTFEATDNAGNRMIKTATYTVSPY